ncbi:hypothetical protein F4777DRAFT_212798 [Nemania sp. FL0916]|nr:hypothetical protein F4777DRAFT_212798 [Nemania sp. FL0916]
MDTLPTELLAKVVSFLPCTTDLKSIRLVNRRYAAIACRPLFELLRFSGSRQDETPPWNFGPGTQHPLYEGQTGRTRTVEFGKLPEVVDEIVGSSLGRYTKTFVFDPAYYRDGFWRDYLMQVENEMHEPVDEVVFDTGDDTNVDSWEAAIERVLEHRRTRPARETDTITTAQIFWNEKMIEQKLNEEAIFAALTKLFRNMVTVEEVKVRAWSFDGRRLFPELESCISYAVDIQRRGSFPSTFFLEILARALHVADRSIRKLQVSEFFANQFHDTPATRHLFTGLREIRIDMIHVEFLSDEAQRFEILVELFKCAQPTLRSLSIVAGGKWPNLPARGGHSLLKMLGDGPDEEPLVFPHLEFLCLGGLILSTPSLLRFICAQPRLKQLEFCYIYLSTLGAGWPTLIEGLPRGIKHWKISGSVGHEPVSADGPVAYNWMTPWEPSNLDPTLASNWVPMGPKDQVYFERAR